MLRNNHRLHLRMTTNFCKMLSPLAIYRKLHVLTLRIKYLKIKQIRSIPENIFEQRKANDRDSNENKSSKKRITEDRLSVMKFHPSYVLSTILTFIIDLLFFLKCFPLRTDHVGNRLLLGGHRVRPPLTSVKYVYYREPVSQRKQLKTTNHRWSSLDMNGVTI